MHFYYLDLQHEDNTEIISILGRADQRDLLLFKKEVISQVNSCKCIAYEKELKQIEALFVQKDYDEIQAILEKTIPNNVICKQEILCYQLQLLSYKVFSDSFVNSFIMSADEQ